MSPQSSIWTEKKRRQTTTLSMVLLPGLSSPLSLPRCPLAPGFPAPARSRIRLTPSAPLSLRRWDRGGARIRLQTQQPKALVAKRKDATRAGGEQRHGRLASRRVPPRLPPPTTTHRRARARVAALVRAQMPMRVGVSALILQTWHRWQRNCLFSRWRASCSRARGPTVSKRLFRRKRSWCVCSAALRHQTRNPTPLTHRAVPSLPRTGRPRGGILGLVAKVRQDLRARRAQCEVRDVSQQPAEDCSARSRPSVLHHGRQRVCRSVRRIGANQHASSCGIFGRRVVCSSRSHGLRGATREAPFRSCFSWSAPFAGAQPPPLSHTRFPSRHCRTFAEFSDKFGLHRGGSTRDRRDFRGVGAGGKSAKDGAHGVCPPGHVLVIARRALLFSCHSHHSISACLLFSRAGLRPRSPTAPFGTFPRA